MANFFKKLFGKKENETLDNMPKRNHSVIVKYEGMDLDELNKALIDEYGSGSTELLLPNSELGKSKGLICEKARLLMLDGHLIGYDDVLSVSIEDETEYCGCGSTTKTEELYVDINGSIKKSETSAGPAYDYDDVEYWGYVVIKYERDGKIEEWSNSFGVTPFVLTNLAFDVAKRACEQLGHINITKERDGRVESWSEKCFDHRVRFRLS